MWDESVKPSFCASRSLVSIHIINQSNLAYANSQQQLLSKCICNGPSKN